MAHNLICESRRTGNAAATDGRKPFMWHTILFVSQGEQAMRPLQTAEDHSCGTQSYLCVKANRQCVIVMRRLFLRSYETQLLQDK